MSRRKPGFQSFSEAAELLRKAFAPKEEPPSAARTTQVANPPSPPQLGRANPFAAVEQAMIDKASAEARRNPGQKSRRKGKHKDQAVEDQVRKKAPGGRAMKVLLKAPGMKAFHRKLIEDEASRLNGASAATAPGPDPDPAIIRQEAIRRITEIVGSSSPAIETRPSKVSPETAVRITDATARGARAFAARPEPDLDNGFIVGFDFGTSSLKLAVHQPYRAGENLAFLRVQPELRSGGHLHLWQTAIWYDPDIGAFSLFPRARMVVLDGFKTGIIGGHGGERVHADYPVTRNEAAIAFVAMQIAHFLGWYAGTRPLNAAGGDHFLAINVGIPVATQDDAKAFATFRHIIVAARNLVGEADELDLTKVREAYQKSNTALPPGWHIVPELTAAIAGYAADPTSSSGSHMLIDVGASTLDIVAFNLPRKERISVISASVELLGSASLKAAREARIAEADCRAACDREFNHVFGDACRQHRGSNGFHPDLRSRDVQLITTGGGCSSTLHAKFIASRNNPKMLGSLAVVRPEPPASCTPEACDRSRLLLAYGLTRDIQELLELRLPSQVPDITPRKGSSPDFISKDMV